MSQTADVIVVGLGAMGSVVLCQLARRGVSAIGVDRFDPPHPHGSSQGESRITRVSISEGARYVPFVRRSHELWREFEALTGRRLLEQVGALFIAPRLNGVTAECVDAATCLYTNAPDYQFIVEAHPSIAQVTIVSACSGHGFKHSAGLGEAIAQYLVGERASLPLAS